MISLHDESENIPQQTVNFYLISVIIKKIEIAIQQLL